MAEASDASVFAEITRSIEPLLGKERQKLFGSYDQLDDVAHTHNAGSQHSTGELIMVTLEPGGEHRWMSFERRRKSWIQISRYGDDKNDAFSYNEGGEGIPAQYEYSKARMRSEPVIDEDLAVIMSGIINDALEQLQSGRASAEIADGV